MPDPLEILVYIHGVMINEKGSSHDEVYQTLHSGIRKHNLNWPAEYVGIEWGWGCERDQKCTHQHLTKAQELLGERLMPALMEPKDFTLNPARLLINGLRKTEFYGFGDIFYYVSKDGKEALRGELAIRILENLQSRTRGDLDTQQISLTLVGHSAGSILAFDLLFFLFFPDEHTFITEGIEGCEEARKLRNLAKNGHLRVRRLITFGSPISMTVFRNNEVLRIFAQGELLKPEHYGLTGNLQNAARLEGPRWINLWDRDDPIAWPVEPLMDAATYPDAVEDIYVDVSDSVSAAHNAYWESTRLHKHIAARW